MVRTPGKSATVCPIKSSSPAISNKDSNNYTEASGSIALLRFLVVQYFCLIYLQKISIPLPSGIPPVSVPLIAFFVGLLFLSIFIKLQMSLIRILLYCGFAAATLFSQTLVNSQISIPSFLLLLLMSFQWVFLWEVDFEFYRRSVKAFVNMMIVPSCLVFLQIISQIVLGMGHSISIEPYIPQALLLPGYNYDAPIQYGATFVRPNGFFMLEPSFISLFLGIAILEEVLLFRCVARMVLFLGALIGTMGATGMVLLMVAAPFVFLRLVQAPKILIRVAVPATTILLFLIFFGIAGQLTGRVSELSSPDSSGNARLIMPADELGIALVDPNYLITGIGAGQLDKETTGSAWPVVKLITEYGFLAMVSYLVLLLVSLIRGPNRPLSIGLLIIFQLTGGYLLNPVVCEAVVLFSTIMAVPVGATQI